MFKGYKDLPTIDNRDSILVVGKVAQNKVRY